MGKVFMLFGGERLIPNFEEDMHVLMNSLHCLKILVLMPPKFLFFQILMFVPLLTQTGRCVRALCCSK